MSKRKQIDLTAAMRLGLAKIPYHKPHTNFGSIVQIGCGYCSKELTCEIRDQKINKAKLGCKEYKEFENNEQNSKRE